MSKLQDRLEELQKQSSTNNLLLNRPFKSKPKPFMGKFLMAIGAIVLIALTVFGLALISGTILYLIYPHIFAMFPNAAKSGVIATTLGWWDAVCVVWIFSILIKSSNSNTNNCK